MLSIHMLRNAGRSKCELAAIMRQLTAQDLKNLLDFALAHSNQGASVGDHGLTLFRVKRVED